MLEPYLGYYLGSESGNYVSSGHSVKSDSSAIAIGARAAYATMGFWLGLDYMVGPDSTVKYSEPSGTADATYSRSVLFFDVGYEVPMLPLRFFGGYGLIDDWKNTSNNGSYGSYSGTAYKVGLGYKPIPLVALNLEYIKHMFTKYAGSNGRSRDIGDIYTSFNASAWFFTVSVPLFL